MLQIQASHFCLWFLIDFHCKCVHVWLYCIYWLYITYIHCFVQTEKLVIISNYLRISSVVINTTPHMLLLECKLYVTQSINTTLPRSNLCKMVSWLYISLFYKCCFNCFCDCANMQLLISLCFAPPAGHCFAAHC